MLGKLEKNIVGMGTYKIIKHMGKSNPKNQMKTRIFEKWLIVTLN
jgi:hypothetical protein